MSEILEQFPTRESFDAYWKENYINLTYQDVKEDFEAFVTSADRHIFISDYEEAGAVSKTDFIENLSETAQFTFQDTLTEAFYEKNPDLYETAFAIYEEEQMSGKGENHVAMIFHEEYHRLYREFLMLMFEEMFQ